MRSLNLHATGMERGTVDRRDRTTAGMVELRLGDKLWQRLYARAARQVKSANFSGKSRFNPSLPGVVAQCAVLSGTDLRQRDASRPRRPGQIYHLPALALIS